MVVISQADQHLLTAIEVTLALTTVVGMNIDTPLETFIRCEHFHQRLANWVIHFDPDCSICLSRLGQPLTR